MSLRIVCIVTLLFSLGACSSKSPEPPQGVLTSAQQKALGEAKNTEQLLQNANAAQLQKIDAASQ